MSLSHPPRHRGLYPVVPTIFNDDGSLDLDGQPLRAVHDRLRRRWPVRAGELFEQFLLADEEREILTRQILQCVDGRVPVIVTTSHFSSTVCVERSRADMGAAMVMVMPPYHGATFRSAKRRSTISTRPCPMRCAFPS